MSKSTQSYSNTHLVVLRAKSGKINRYHKFMGYKNSKQIEGWSATKKFYPGDLALFYFGEPLKSVVALGIVESDYYEEVGPFDWTKKTKAVFCDYKPVWFLKNDFPLTGNFTNTVLKKWYKGKPYRSTREIPQQVSSILLNEIITLNPQIRSGLIKRGFK